MKMRSKRSSKQITTKILFALLHASLLSSQVSYTTANSLQEERREYQVQRSSKAIGSHGDGYFNSQTSNIDQQADTNLAERLRQEFNSALSNAGNDATSNYYRKTSYSTGNLGNGVGCTTECRLLPGYSGKSQSELDIIAHDMTNQIVTDLRTGKLQRSQVNQPNWFEHRVAEKMSDLEQQHQLEFERNLQSAASRFRQGTANEWTNLQQQQQQQNLYEQSQHQQQGTNFQQQSQSQHNFGYVQPIVSGNSYQKVIEERHKEINSNAVYPTPITVLHGSTILQQNNCTDQSQVAGIYPHYNAQNQYNHRVESNRETTGGTTYVRPVVGGSTYHVTTTVERNEKRLPQRPVIIPTQNSYTHQIEEEQREIRRQQQIPQVYGVNQQNRTQHTESSNVRVYNPAPVTPITTNSHHTIYNQVHESEVVPNYRPRVVIDKNTKFHELEVRNHHRDYQPVVVPVPTTTTHVKEEEQIDRQYQQKPIYQPQVTTTTVTEEKIESNQQKNRRPIIQYPQSTVTQDISEEVKTTHHTAQPQYPIFSHTTNVQSFNESRNTNQHTTIKHQPGGQHVTTIKETHYVQILPQPANQYTVQYTDEEYLERLDRIRQELRRLGYGTLTEDEYNATIASGGFIHNGFKYLYNDDRGRYEKTERVEISEEEYHSLLRRLQNQLQQYGLSQMTEREFNKTIEEGFFVQNGVRYVYDSETGSYRREEITDDQYIVLRQRIQDELNRREWGTLTEREFNQTIATGQLNINGHKYTLNKQTGQFEHAQEVEISEQEYRTILRRLQDQLRRLGFEQMTEREYNQTISTGYFVRGGHKYRYNADIGRYEKVEITDEEYTVILYKLKDTLQRLNYRQMSERESNETIASGTFIRGGYQWTYNTETGEANPVRVAAPFEEISDTEYKAIYRRLQQTLSRLGYPRMTQSECNSTITTGSFTRGGNQWVYQPQSGEFQRIELSENEYNFRVERLTEILTRLGIQKTTEEQRDIIYRGNFYHGGHRYEYDTVSGQFVRVQMTESEYRQRVRQLLEQLQQIGYGTMTESECRATINSGVFYYGGHEWVYNYETGQYDMGKVSDKENGIVDDNYFNNIGFDYTNYTSSKTDDGEKTNAGFDIDREDGKNGRKKEIISKNRGDQPPQTFEEDYDESEELEKEPGIGYYTKPKERLTPQPTPKPTTQKPIVIPPYIAPLAPYTSESDSKRFESQKQETVLAVPPPTQETEYEQRYHHKKTTYTQTSGIIPVNQEILSRPRKSGSTAIDTELNDNFPQATIAANYNDKFDQAQQTRNGFTTQKKSEKLENFGDVNQQYDDWSQQSEDVQQHVIDAEDFTHDFQHTKLRQHEDVPTNTRFSGVPHRNFNLFDDSTPQIIVEAKQVKEEDSQPGFWDRLKQKAKKIVG